MTARPQSTVGLELWREVGVSLPANAGVDEVLARAHFYDVVEQDLTVGSGSVVPDRKALVRADTGKYLATVGRKYQPVQFQDVFRTVVEASAGLGVQFRAAGTFGPNGVRAWMLAELPNPLVIEGDESPIRKFLLAVAGHDGQTAVLLKNTAVRIWCSNSIGAALRSEGGLWRIHHTPSALQRLDDVARGFRRLKQSFETLGLLGNRLVATPFTQSQMRSVATRLLPVANDGLDHSRVLQSQEKILELFEQGVGVTAAIRGTAWAAVNSVTEFYDHHRPMKGRGRADAVRLQLESSWLGTAARKKQEALSLIAQESGVELAAA